MEADLPGVIVVDFPKFCQHMLIVDEVHNWVFGIVSLADDIIPGYKEVKLNTRNGVEDPLVMIGSCCGFDRNNMVKPLRH